MKINQEKIWAGTEESLSAALEANEGISARLSAGNYQEQEEDDDNPRLLEISDGVAVVSIKGSLNNDEGFWNEMFGMTGYPEIRDAMLAAANDASVKQILLDIDSGGGAVSGCEDTAKLIRLIHNQVKPVTAFTDGTMASAAYWLGSSAGNVYSGKTAVSGSIGVISTHMEKSQALKDAGIGVTVVRAGKFKALANSVEKLTAEGKAQIQQVVDAAYGIFVDHVAEMRGKSYEYADNTMAQGREFIGQSAVDAGLVDSISTFDQVMGSLKEKAIDPSRNSMDNRGKNSLRLSGETSITLSGDTNMAKKALTAQDIAALASGAVIDAAAQPVVVSDVVVDAEALAVTDAALPNGDGVTDQPEGNAPAADTGNDDKTAATVQLLSAQLKEKDADLLQAHLKIAKLEEAGAEASASQGPLMQIAAQSVSNMSIALNGPTYKADGNNAAQILAEHARLSEQFTAKFKAGGVAAVMSTEATHQPQDVQIDPRHTARVNAVRFNK
jgi:signal peptide peptidase SppA